MMLSTSKGLPAAFVLPAGFTCLALLTLINVQALPVQALIQSLLLYGGIALIVLAFLPPPFASFTYLRFKFLRVPPSLPVSILSPVLAILLLALILRLIGLSTFVSMYMDELYPASQVTRLRENPFTPILTPMDEPLPFTWVYVSWQYASTLVFGANLFALRVVGAVFGTLTVWATYHLAAVWYGRSVGLLAALVLATFPPHVHLSRLGIINVPDALFGVLALWLLSRAWQGERTWAMAGAALGATAYFHEGGRLLYPALTALWMLTCIGGWRTRGRGLMTFVACALLTAAPVLITLAATGQALSPRLADAGVTGEFWWALLASPVQDGLWTVYLRDLLAPALLHYVSLPDSSLIYYGGQTALVLPYLVPFFLIGIIVLVLRLRQPAPRLLLLWLLGTAIGNSFLGFTVNRYTARFLVAFPAIAITVAVGMWTIITLTLNPSACASWRGTFQSRFAALNLQAKTLSSDMTPKMIFAMSIVFIVLALGQVVYYFAIHLPEYNRQIRSVPDEVDVIQRTAALPDGTQAYLITDVPYYRGAFDILPRFWGVDLSLMLLTTESITDSWLDALPAPPLAFFIEHEDSATLARLRARYPSLSTAIASPYNVPADKQYALYTVVLE
jgi:4-amino-4-deoxy-L-arabinose transferase-like glycosyltransferase